jgi:hypothetical protein
MFHNIAAARLDREKLRLTQSLGLFAPAVLNSHGKGNYGPRLACALNVLAQQGVLY